MTNLVASYDIWKWSGQDILDSFLKPPSFTQEDWELYINEQSVGAKALMENKETLPEWTQEDFERSEQRIASLFLRDYKLSVLTLLANISTFTRNMPDDASWSEICKLETAREQLLAIHSFLYRKEANNETV